MINDLVYLDWRDLFDPLVSRIEWFDPPAARVALDTNPNNRPQRHHWIASCAAEMRAGLWRCPAQALLFARTGPDRRLDDGQHRLAAVIEADVGPVPFVVIEGVAEDAFSCFDSGPKRTTGDRLSIEGVPKANAIAAIARVVLAHDLDIMTDQNKERRTVTNARIGDFALESNNSTRLSSAHSAATALHKTIKVPSAHIGALFFIIRRSASSTTDAERFETALITGSNLNIGDPVLAFRSRLIAAAASKRRLNRAEIVYTGIRIWNAWRSGQQVSRVQLWNVRQPKPRVQP